MQIFLGIFNGILITVMNLFNSKLSSVYGNYKASFIIHLVGLTCIFLFSFNKVKLKKKVPVYFYLGGAIGILTVLFSNITISTLGVTITLVLSMIGQIIASMVMDKFGLFSIRVSKFRKEKLISLILIGIGAVVMIIW